MMGTIKKFLIVAMALSLPIMAGWQGKAGGFGSTSWNGGEISVPILLPDGTVTVPALAFSSDTGLGIYQSGLGYLCIAQDGANIACYKAIRESFDYGDIDTGADTITITGTALGNNKAVVYNQGAGLPPTGLSDGAMYFIVGKVGDALQISTTQGGSALDITATGDGTGHTLTYIYGSIGSISGYGNALILPSADSGYHNASFPSIQFDDYDADGVSGIRESAADVITMSIEETDRYDFGEKFVSDTLMDGATGNEYAFSIEYTTNKSGCTPPDCDDYGLVVNQTATSAPGTSYLFSFEVGGARRVWASAGGNLYAGGLSAFGAGLFAGSTSSLNTANVIAVGYPVGSIGYEGATVDDYEVFLTSQDADADAAVELPAQSGSVETRIADSTPGTPDALDDEFMGGAFSGWTWITDAGGSTDPTNIDVTTAVGIVLVDNANVAETFYGYKTCSFSGDFTVTARVLSGNYNDVTPTGIFVCDDNGSNGRVLYTYNHNAGGNYTRTGSATMTTWADTPSDTNHYNGPLEYLRIKRISGNIYLLTSRNGITWSRELSAADATTFTRVELYCNLDDTSADANFPPVEGFHWFRVVD